VNRGSGPSATEQDMTRLQPFDLFRDWYGEACRSAIAIPNAMALSTAGFDGNPS